MNLTVFLSARDGKNPTHLLRSKKLGEAITRSGHTLVYGGSQEGCMGAVSDAVLENKGQVIAVYPEGVLPLEPPRQNATELYLAKNMDERKRKLIDLGEAFIILPGGFGTMEEVFQLLTEMSIGQTEIRPVIFIDKDFYLPLFNMIQQQTKEEMLSLEVLEAVHLVETTEQAMQLLGDLNYEQAI
ncbi:TIGR00730 family Rossman fold protein [Lactococcus formosensis]|jgi:TIGR00730 family protein|uniref:Cytokinin riboside 5'-monophosphate phosphoribohydrolase n=1 Tax=Lactococcus formosensis TaxID=1281486 RepID=A0A9X4SDT8_9LACT|nr:TIGR00730 family Rossman fold protein [Lactococcus formosensis]NHI68124.1 TIGR00730 family Rossman fold protein [Lactococcus garvieae]MDG6126999.1 TIGR00730 family Rossman fold protein [Lactococcus formosensis]MDG6133230.1 TIGR00730 family Rossman fold protein [Lactococcus formosensis]MDG6135225.1 TIGR00730 family Rossman fold protein [Lactococcus formosensis]MDG6141340.1 TIGR00730 family Rossman fold protein [Lactococcus formosensis]